MKDCGYLVSPTYPTQERLFPQERLCIDELWNSLPYCMRSMIKQSIAEQIIQQSHLLVSILSLSPLAFSTRRRPSFAAQ